MTPIGSELEAFFRSRKQKQQTAVKQPASRLAGFSIQYLLLI